MKQNLLIRGMFPVFLFLMILAGVEEKFAGVLNVSAETKTEYDVAVYGATPAGISSAVAASEEGVSVLLIGSREHIGGHLTSGVGLGELWHFAEKDPVNRGLFHRTRQLVRKHYGRTVRIPEPHVIESILERMVEKAGVELIRNSRVQHVEKTNRRVTTMEAGGEKFSARVFIDASYTGDLIAASDLTYTYGREPRSKFNESLAGVIFRDDAYSFSGLNEKGAPLAMIDERGLPEEGTGDRRSQTCNLFLCLTNKPENRVPFQRPKSYNADNFKLLSRYIKKENLNGTDLFFMSDIPGNKKKINNNPKHLVSVGLSGGAWGYTEMNVRERQRVYDKHRRYVHSFFYFLQNDGRVPEDVRKSMQKWGLAKDEYEDNNHWPYRLYLREGRRIVGDWIMTQDDLTREVTKPDTIALGGFPADSHNVRRLVTEDGRPINEGRYFEDVPTYEISYRVLLPKRKEATNLLSPVCMSASRVAFNSMRVVPTWMSLGEASGVAASLAVREEVEVQNVPVDTLQNRLRDRGYTLTAE